MAVEIDVSDDMGATWTRLNAGVASSRGPRPIVWFSCGAASAVAARVAVNEYPDAQVVYCDTLSTTRPRTPAVADPPG